MVHSKILRPRREWCNDAILRPRREDGRYQRFLRPRKEWCSGVFKDTQTRRNWGGLGTGASAAYHRSQGDSGFVIAPRGIAVCELRIFLSWPTRVVFLSRSAHCLVQ